MELAREVLDNQVIDRRGRKLGKVDGIVLAASAGRPLRVVAIEVGAAPLVQRLHARGGRWLERWMRRHGQSLSRTRIPWRRVRHVGPDVRVAVDGERTRALALERWLRDRIVSRIPGAG